MSKVNFFAQGLGLKPLSADPTSPTDGQLYMSDGTVRAAGLWRYSSTSVAWLAVGSGGGGLDVFHTEDFESNGASDFNTGNAATVDAAGTGTLDGTLADETSAPFSADASLKYTMGSTSANDFFLQDADIAIELKQTSNDVGVSFYYTYNGADSDLRFFALDQDDAELTDSIDYLEAASTPTRFTTSFYIPAGTTGIRYGFQVVTGNSAKILIVDDIELSLNPFVYKNLIELGLETKILSADVTTNIVLSDLTFSNLVVGRTYNIGGQVRLRSNAGSTNSTVGLDIDNGVTRLGALDSSIATTGGGISTPNPNITFVATDTTLTFTATSAAVASPISGDGTRDETFITLTEYIISEHVVTPAKSNLTDWTPYTPTTQGLGTVSSVDFYYKQIGDSYHIQGKLTLGTPTASEIQISIPNSKTVKAGLGIRAVGVVDYSANLSMPPLVAITGGDSYVNVTYMNTAGLSPQNGSALFNASSTISINAIVPIEGLSSDAQFLAAVPVQKVAYIKDVKSSGGQSGTFTSGSFLTRELNTISGDSEIVTLSSNQFTLSSGKYLIECSAAAYDVESHKTQLYNITDSTVEAEGTSEYAYTTANVQSRSFVDTSVTLTTSKTFELQHRCATTKADTGFGLDNTFGVNEVYAQVKITKLR